MEVQIVREQDGYSMFVDGEFFGKYDSPIQAALALEEMKEEEKDEQES